MSKITWENLSIELKAGVCLLDGPMSLSALAESMGVSKRDAGRALDVLFDQGQVRDGWTKDTNGTHYKEVWLSPPMVVPFYERVRDTVKK